MINKLKKYYTYPLYIAFATIMGFIYYYLPKISDDTFNSDFQEYHSLKWTLDNSASQYDTWSDRYFINIWMYISTNFMPKWIYATITAIITLIIIVFLTYQLRKKPYLWLAGILACLIFPFNELGTAGYIATTVTYLYPVALGMLGLTLLNTKHWYFKIWSFPLFIFSFNNEELCVLVGIYLIYYIITQYKQWKDYLWILIPWIISFAIVMHSPGNHSRQVYDAKRFLPKFLHFSLIDKINVGTITTIQHYLFSVSVPIIVLSTILLLINYKKHAILAWIPLFVVTGTSMLALLVSKPHHFVTTPPQEFTNIAIATYLLGFIWFIATIYLIHNWQLNILLIAGLASRSMLGFSPTVYFSATRTFIFCDIVIIYLIIQLITKHHWAEPTLPVMILLLAAGFNIAIEYGLIAKNGYLYVNTQQYPLILWYLVK